MNDDLIKITEEKMLKAIENVEKKQKKKPG